MSEEYDWSADIAKLPMPVLLAFADNDSISQRHVAEFFAMLGGGVKEPGWLNMRLSKSRLALVPGYSHYNFISSTEVPQIIGKFLADPLTNPPAGAARRLARDVGAGEGPVGLDQKPRVHNAWSAPASPHHIGASGGVLHLNVWAWKNNLNSAEAAWSTIRM